MTTVPRYEGGKLMAAGESHSLRNAVFEGPMPVRGAAKPGAVRRKCAKCGRQFRQTVKRQVLCQSCYQHASGDMGTAL